MFRKHDVSRLVNFQGNSCRFVFGAAIRVRSDFIRFPFVSDLFTVANASRPKPLADRLRPTRLEEVVGQDHLLAPGRLLRRKLDDGQIGSMLLFGPPGIGKTTIARAMANYTKKEFRPLNAIKSSVADLRAIMDEAEKKSLVVFLDECHRWPSNKQDSLLEATESGLFDLIMATTESPSHNMVHGLLSRSSMFILKALERDSIHHLINKGLRYYRDEGIEGILEGAALERAITIACRDGRRALLIVEGLLQKRPAGKIVITIEMVEEVAESIPLGFDETVHYDVTSAFCKSMRGGDEDGTLLWMSALLKAGVDPMYVARRIVAHASEDVGLADNTALATAQAAMYTVERIGLPEAAINLAHAALHVCRAPKSNSAYRGLSLAQGWVEQNGIPEVPKHLCDTHYKGAAAMGNVGYQFPHDFDEGWANQSYLPKGVSIGSFYQSDARESPTFEARADGYWDRIKKRLTPRRFAHLLERK